MNNYFAGSSSEEGSYLRLMTFASLNSRLESNKEEEKSYMAPDRPDIQARDVASGFRV